MILKAFSALLLASTLLGCKPKPAESPVVGTWELIAATSTENDSTFSTFDPSRKMIKILNATHFAFLNHSIKAGNDSAAAGFSAGGGTYTVVDSTYTEHLEYFTDKNWENHQFQFVVTIRNDTLVQKGVERIEKLGIDRVITETYRRVNQ